MTASTMALALTPTKCHTCITVRRVFAIGAAVAVADTLISAVVSAVTTQCSRCSSRCSSEVVKSVEPQLSSHSC